MKWKGGEKKARRRQTSQPAGALRLTSALVALLVETPAVKREWTE